MTAYPSEPSSLPCHSGNDLQPDQPHPPFAADQTALICRSILSDRQSSADRSMAFPWHSPRLWRPLRPMCSLRQVAPCHPEGNPGEASATPCMEAYDLGIHQWVKYGRLAPPYNPCRGSPHPRCPSGRTSPGRSVPSPPRPAVRVGSFSNTPCATYHTTTTVRGYAANNGDICHCERSI